MPLEYIMLSIDDARRKKSFPHPIDHVFFADGWNNQHNVTVSSFNSTHHKSQREYFDRPIVVPEKGYSHIRKLKQIPF